MDAFASWVLFFFISSCFMYYHWSQKKLRKLAACIPGPPAYPIVGSGYLFMNFADIAENGYKIIQKYGATVKLWIFSVLIVIITKPRHLQIVLNHPKCLEKDKRYDFSKEAFGEGLLTAKASIWKNHRKIINPTFNQRILDSFMDVFVAQGLVLVRQLEKELGAGEFDVHDYLSRCSMDIICETAMGVQGEAQIRPSRFLHATRRAAQLIVERAVRVWLHPKFIFQYSQRGREFYESLEFAREYIEKLVAKRYEEYHSKKEQQLEIDESAKKPFLEHLLTFGNKLTQQELINEVAVFITAGTDTITTTTGYVLVCLGMHNEVQERVVEELDEIFGKTGRPVALSDLPKLAYLERVIKETMRLYPPAPLIARSVGEDVDLGELTLPAGCAAVIGIIGTHRDPEIWPDPMKFDPDRFLPEEAAKRHPYSYVPFSAGPRNCIGIRFAMMSMKVLLSTILRSYQVGTSLRPEQIKLSVEIVSKIIGGSRVSLSRR